MTFRRAQTHVIPSATIRGRDPISLAKTAATLGVGAMKALRLLRRIRPVGGGRLRRLSDLAAGARRDAAPNPDRDPRCQRRDGARQPDARPARHRDRDELSRHDARCARSPPRRRSPAIRCGRWCWRPRRSPTRRSLRGGAFNLLVTGGSQGARVMADVVPPAIEAMAPELRARLAIVQQARGEDETRVREAYARLGVKAEVAPFFSDLPARIAASHLIVSRSGASTVAELAAIGRPSILVPLPHALDQDQLANANVLAKAGGAIVLKQDDFTPDRLARRDRGACGRSCQAFRHGGRREVRRRARCRGAARRSGVARGECGTALTRAEIFAQGNRHETADRYRPHPFRRHRRHRHERHRRGADQSRLHGAGLGRVRLGEREAAARQGRQGRGRPRGGESRRGRSRRRLDRDQARQPGACGGARQAPAGGAARRDAGRADAAQALRRDRRHARQDHHDLDGRDAARCRRLRSDRHQWRHHQRLRHQCAARRRRLDGGRGGRVRRHVPQAAGRRRDRHQYRRRASRSLQDLRGGEDAFLDLRRRTCRSTASP